MRASRPWLAATSEEERRELRSFCSVNQPSGHGLRASDPASSSSLSPLLRATVEEPVRPCRECTVLPRASDASDAIPSRGSRLLPSTLARGRTGAPSNRPHGQLARASGATLSRRALTHPKTRSSSPPFGRLRHPRHRPVILGGGQPPSSASRSRLPLPRKGACATPKGSLSPGAFHHRRASSRSLPHRPSLLTDESMSETSNAIMTSRSRPLRRGPMTGLPSVPGLDTLGSSALASFFPRDIAASR